MAVVCVCGLCGYMCVGLAGYSCVGVAGYSCVGLAGYSCVGLAGCILVWQDVWCWVCVCWGSRVHVGACACWNVWICVCGW